MRTLFSALSACENRCKRTGNLERAEVAFVAQALFDLAPSEILSEHPLIQNIGIQTLRVLVEQFSPSDSGHPDLENVFSEVLETGDSEYQQEETLSNIFSDVIAKEPAFANVESQPVDGAATLIVPVESEPNVPRSIPSPDSLPAKALYKNFNGLAIKETLKGWEGHTLEKETATQLDFFNEEQELYITVTENRLQLHAHSEAELSVAMEELEAHCQSALMYLAKTYKEGGNTDGTE